MWSLLLYKGKEQVGVGRHKGLVAGPRFCVLQVANTWRATQDISLDIQATWGTVMNNLEGTTGLARFAGPGAWNDADMLEVKPQIPHVQAAPHARMRRNLGTEMLPWHHPFR